MSEENTVPEVSATDELQDAMNRLAAAKQKMADAEALRLGALRAKVAALDAERQRVAAAEKAEYERIEAIHIARRAADREAEAKLIREENARNQELQRQIAVAEEEQRVIRVREQKLQQIMQEADSIERAAQAATAAALADLTSIEAGVPSVIQVDGTSDDEHKRHPLARFFQSSSEPVVPVNDGSLSSERTSQDQHRADLITNSIESGVYPVHSAPQSAATPVPAVEVLPHRRAKPMEDRGLSVEVEGMILQALHINANRTTLDRLASIFTQEALINSTRVAIAQAQQQPMSHDQLLQLLEDLANNTSPVGGSNG